VLGYPAQALQRGQEGLAQMCQGLESFRATGAEHHVPNYLACLAEAYGAGGQTDEGLACLDEALAFVYKNGERFWEAEVYRLKGVLLLTHSADQQGEAERCFQQALTVARLLHARSLELRAATSPARLWQQQGKRTAAHALLAPIYGWFTEGFDTADLQDAKALLEDLGI
jgi:predicted ATPase